MPMRHDVILSVAKNLEGLGAAIDTSVGTAPIIASPST